MKNKDKRSRPAFFLFMLTFSFTLLYTAGSAQTQPDADKPGLWKRAVSAYSQSQNLIPGRLLISFSMLSGKGEVSEGREQEVRCFLDDKTGEIQSEILWAREKGENVTEKARSQQKKQSQKAGKPGSKKRSITLGHDDLPLAISRQSGVTVRPTAEQKILDGHRCQGFDFSMKVLPKDEDDEPTLMKGRAWIDEERGLPMELSFTSDPLPSKVKSMISTYSFQPDAQGRWVVKEFTMEGSGGFLFIKKQFRSRIVMSDYFPKPVK